MNLKISIAWSRILLSCGAALLAFAVTARAAEREHGAHQHGVSHMNIAIEDKSIEIELIAPGADIVGFEHATGTAINQVAVKNALAALKNGGDFFVFSAAAGCRLQEAETVSDLTEEHHDEHEKHGQAHEKQNHAEFHARYLFQCDTPARISHVDVKLFQRFPTLREVEVQAVTVSGQSATELTPAAPRLMF